MSFSTFADALSFVQYVGLHFAQPMISSERNKQQSTIRRHRSPLLLGGIEKMLQIAMP
jgi:hypothetical protein